MSNTEPTQPEQAPELAAERAVIGSCLIDHARFGAVQSRLRADDFGHPAHSTIWRTMAELAQEHGQCPDLVLLSDRLRTSDALGKLEGGVAYLTALVGEAAPERVEQHAGVVSRASAVRAVRLLGSSLGDVAERDIGAAQSALLAIQRKLREAQTGKRRAGVALADAVAETMATLDDRCRRRVDGGAELLGLSTGITGLDYLTGGFRAGTANVIAAPPGIGKTALACQIAILGVVAAQTPCFFVSAEMRPAELVERFFARLARVDSQSMRNGSVDLDGWKRIHATGAQMIHGAGMTITGTRSLPAIEAEARAFRVEHPGERFLVVVDYIQLLRGTNRGAKRHEELAEITGALKNLSVELECPVIELSQLKRGLESEGRDPELSDLRESGSIEQDADTVTFLVRERHAEQSMRGSVPARLILAKNRHGETGEVRALWDGKHYELRDDEAPAGNVGHWSDSDA